MCVWGEPPDRIGVRRLWTYVNGLPIEAATFREELREEGRWTTAHELAALAIERSDRWLRAVAQPHYKNRLADPIEIPRPGEEPKQRANVVTLDEFAKQNAAQGR